MSTNCQDQSHRGIHSVKKSILKNFVKLTEERLCRNLFFNKVACLTGHILERHGVRVV